MGPYVESEMLPAKHEAWPKRPRSFTAKAAETPNAPGRFNDVKSQAGAFARWVESPGPQKCLK